MKYIDLHVHSSASDGTLSPTEVVQEAYKNGLTAFALTDHDTIDGIEEAMQAAMELKKEQKSVSVIPGVELSVEYKERDIHMLGLFIDYKNTAFCTALEQARLKREERNEKMIQNLSNAGIDISMENLRAMAGENTVLTRAHFAKYLMEHKIVKNMKEAFEIYLHEKSPYYVPRKYITPEDAIRLILGADGIPVLAHPLLYRLPAEELNQLISRLKKHGLIGIEAIYSANIGFEEGIVRRLANQYDLCITGGSDFHGANKPHIAIGKGKGNLKIPYSLIDHLLQAKS